MIFNQISIFLLYNDAIKVQEDFYGISDCVQTL